MATHPITPIVDLNEYFSSLARQAMDFHHALAELIDNALSARIFTPIGDDRDANPALVEIAIEELPGGQVQMIVADSGVGMSIADLQQHVFGLGQRGSTSSAQGSMNEHGFGLKNALSVLTGGDSSRFSLVTRSDQDKLKPDQFVVVQGPFSKSMTADDSSTRSTAWAPGLQQLGAAATGTRVQVTSDSAFFRTTWRRRGSTSKFEAYVTRLAEHLGVLYRRFIDRGDKIYLRYKSSQGDWSQPISVLAINPPYGGSQTVQLTIRDNGTDRLVTYIYGENDYQIRDEGPNPARVVQGDGDPAYPYPLKIYYQGSSSRSGADIIVRRRVIQTQVWKEIWPDLDHTVEYNTWLAEIILDENFRTTNNKTGMDPGDSAWQALLDLIGPKDSPYSPSKTSPKQTEKSIQDRLAEYLKIQVGDSTLIAQYVTTWQGATEADVVVYAPGQQKIEQIWEVKAGRGTVDDVYQLVAQWDGFVRDGLRPNEGVLYCSTADHKPTTAVMELNKRKDALGVKYNLRITGHVGSDRSANLGVPATNAKKAPVKKAPVKKAPVKKAPVKKSPA